MRRYLLLTLLCALVASPAFGQRKSSLQQYSGQSQQGELTEEELREARRKAAGIKDLKDFGAKHQVPEKPFPWMAVGLAFIALMVSAPFGWKMYRSTRRDLEDQATFGMSKGRREGKEPATDERGLSRRPPRRGLKAEAKPEEPAAEEARSGRDAVWDALGSASGSWVTADWVATNAGLSPAEAQEEIGALVEEGYLQEARDRNGKPVFRAA